MRYMQTCHKCPVKYPWIGNFEGANEGHRIADLTKDTEDDVKEDDAREDDAKR